MAEWILKYWIEVAFGAVLAALSYGYKKLSNRQKERAAKDKAIEDGIVALLHDRLYGECTQYIKNDSITVPDLKNIEYMYRAYHSLGGNGTGTELYERAKALEIKGE